MKILSNNRGYSFVEMLLYVAMLTMISLVVMRTILVFSGSYRTIGLLRITENSGVAGMERMTRDIRNATNIITASSTLGVHPGVLTLTQTNGTQSTTTKFYIQNGTLNIDVNGVNFGPLTDSNVTVSNLVFSLVTGSTTNAVKVDMTLSATNGSVTKTKTYHTTVVMSGN